MSDAEKEKEEKDIEEDKEKDKEKGKEKDKEEEEEKRNRAADAAVRRLLEAPSVFTSTEARKLTTFACGVPLKVDFLTPECVGAITDLFTRDDVPFEARYQIAWILCNVSTVPKTSATIAHRPEFLDTCARMLDAPDTANDMKYQLVWTLANIIGDTANLREFVVAKVLGAIERYALERYARMDVASLRICAFAFHNVHRGLRWDSDSDGGVDPPGGDNPMREALDSNLHVLGTLARVADPVVRVSVLYAADWYLRNPHVDWRTVNCYQRLLNEDAPFSRHLLDACVDSFSVPQRSDGVAALAFSKTILQADRPYASFLLRRNIMSNLQDILRGERFVEVTPPDEEDISWISRAKVVATVLQLISNAVARNLNDVLELPELLDTVHEVLVMSAPAIEYLLTWHEMSTCGGYERKRLAELRASQVRASAVGVYQNLSHHARFAYVGGVPTSTAAFLAIADEIGMEDALIFLHDLVEPKERPQAIAEMREACRKRGEEPEFAEAIRSEALVRSLVRFNDLNGVRHLVEAYHLVLRFRCVCNAAEHRYVKLTMYMLDTAPHLATKRLASGEPLIEFAARTAMRDFVRLLAARGCALGVDVRNFSSVSEAIRGFIAMASEEWTPVHVACDARDKAGFKRLLMEGHVVPESAARIASSADYPMALPVNKELARRARAATLPWSPSTHALWPPPTRSAVAAVVCAARGLNVDVVLSHVLRFACRRRVVSYI